MMSTDAVDAIAADLYSGPLDEFVARRNALASNESDRTLATRIRTLRKPSVAAWVVNVFASERSGELREALQLAAELREAQADLDATALSQLGRQRRALTARLAAEAAALARARGERVTDATLEAVRQTLSAAFFDPDAAAAVASGRLVHDLEPSGAFPLDVNAAVGGGAPSAPEPPPVRADEVAARRERRKAEKALHDAEQARARAAREQDEAHRDASGAEQRAEAVEVRIAELEEELRRLRHESRRALDDAAAAAERHDAATRRLTDAEQDVELARRALEALHADER